MKYFIVGFNASGKQAIVNELQGLGVKVGKIFRSIDIVPENIYSLSSIVYSQEDINNIFENRSYKFIKENKMSTEPFFEGLSFYEYDNNDVFMITPEQFSLIPKFDKDVLFIWLDNNNKQRRERFLTEKRKYNFSKQENLERFDINDFIDRMSSSKYLYFFNEEPSRVAAIIYSMIKHPDLVSLYKNSFN